MTDPVILDEPARRHGNSGRRQTAAHTAKRVAAIAATKAKWTAERRTEISARVSAQNPMRSEDARQKSSRSHKGQIPWNKGNNWRNGPRAAEIRKRMADRAKHRRATDPQYRINGRMAALMNRHLKKRGGSKGRFPWSEIVGYSVAELDAHLKTTVPPGYSWDDFMSGVLHIDHKIPVAAHNFTSFDDIDFQRCWALSNLCLLTQADNSAKQDKLSAPFQPSLALAMSRGAAV